MNNNGKLSSIFMILIPIFFIVSLLIVDTLINIIENNRYKKVTESIIAGVVNNDDILASEYKDEIKKAYERQGFQTSMLVVMANDYEVHVENEHEFFGIISAFSKRKGDDEEIKIFGLTFKIKKNSVARLSVNAKYDSEGSLIFEYTE